MASLQDKCFNTLKEMNKRKTVIEDQILLFLIYICNCEHDMTAANSPNKIKQQLNWHSMVRQEHPSAPVKNNLNIYSYKDEHFVKKKCKKLDEK